MPNLVVPNPFGGSISTDELDFVTAELVFDTVLTGNAQQVDMEDLDLETDGVYLLVAFVKNGDGGNQSNISLYYNADLTATNYYVQSFGASAGGVSGARTNAAIVMDPTAGDNAFISGEISKIVGEEPMAVIAQARGAPAAVITNEFRHVWTGTANVTKIILKSDVATGIGTGSIIRLFKLGGS